MRKFDRIDIKVWPTTQKTKPSHNFLDKTKICFDDDSSHCFHKCHKLIIYPCWTSMKYLTYQKNFVLQILRLKNFDSTNIQSNKNINVLLWFLSFTQYWHWTRNRQTLTNKLLIKVSIFMTGLSNFDGSLLCQRYILSLYCFSLLSHNS